MTQIIRLFILFYFSPSVEVLYVLLSIERLIHLRSLRLKFSQSFPRLINLVPCMNLCLAWVYYQGVFDDFEFLSLLQLWKLELWPPFISLFDMQFSRVCLFENREHAVSNSAALTTPIGAQMMISLLFHVFNLSKS